MAASLTESITWKPVSSGLPDAELNVLLAAGELGTFEGFLDSSEPVVFRDVTAMPVEGVTHWADMPEGPGA